MSSGVDQSPEVMPEEALAELPIFPLSGVLLLPQTIVSLHVFEPRYRRMMEDVTDGHRAFAIGLLVEDGDPDRFERPPIFEYAGAGLVRRSARLPDGRFNILIEGMGRIRIHSELDPDPSIPYRRVKAEIMRDVLTEDTNRLQTALNGLRSLCAPVVRELGGDNEFMERLNEIEAPGALADTVAAAVVTEAADRFRLVAEVDVVRRLELVSGVLGALYLQAQQSQKSSGWGTNRGEA